MGRSTLNSPALGNFVVYELLKFGVRRKVKVLNFMKFSIRSEDTPVGFCRTFGFESFGNNLFLFSSCFYLACRFCSRLRADTSGKLGERMPFTAYTESLIPAEGSTFNLILT